MISSPQTIVSSQWVNLMRYFKLGVRRQLKVSNSSYGKSDIFLNYTYSDFIVGGCRYNSGRNSVLHSAVSVSQLLVSLEWEEPALLLSLIPGLYW